MTKTIRLSDAIKVVQDNLAFSVKAHIIEALSALPAVDGWLLIGEDFPHLPVLLSRPDGDGLRYTPTTGFNDATGVWRVFRSEGGMEPLPFVPTHYMPLPAPPIE